MNKQNIVLFPLILVALAVLALCSCNINHNNISITTKDNHKHYQFNAKFHKRKTEKVRQCLNNNLMRYSNVSLENDYINETIVLNDDTRFYLYTAPGRIKVKLNKYENSEAAYEEVKKICENIKQQIQNN